MNVKPSLTRTSARMAGLCFILAGAFPLLTIANWVWPSYFQEAWGTFDRLPFPREGLTTSQAIVACAFGMVSAFIASFALVKLARVFREFEKNRPFSEYSIRCFRFFALAIFVFCLSMPIVESLQGVALSWDRGPGSRIFALTFQAHNMRDIGFAFLLMMLGLMFGHARGLADEQEHML